MSDTTKAFLTKTYNFPHSIRESFEQEERNIISMRLHEYWETNGRTIVLHIEYTTTESIKNSEKTRKYIIETICFNQEEIDKLEVALLNGDDIYCGIPLFDYITHALENHYYPFNIKESLMQIELPRILKEKEYYIKKKTEILHEQTIPRGLDPFGCKCEVK